ncbi:transport protein particle (TRAPP) component, Bet3 [Trichinella spiralis]|uniref:transport protein particle (TRAPP) component, Bet3 n=1 Tax=Trichinella spiralis TaxID=6334 RepID=UPI0001EFCD30|nr:transport protein particle (TRAPP) component, Bet3 [Trichinella spiralis]
MLHHIKLTRQMVLHMNNTNKMILYRINFILRLHHLQHAKYSYGSTIYPSANVNMALKISNKTPGILDVTISKGKNEINLATFALLFSEVVRYSQSRVTTISELQTKLASYGKIVGSKLVDLIFFRDKGYKRESIFGKEADKLERNNYIIEREPLVNTFISVPKDKGNLNCASFTGGIIEAYIYMAPPINHIDPCKVTTVWHNGTTYVIEFEESVLAKEKLNENK